jgi:hypothetical protein
MKSAALLLAVGVVFLALPVGATRADTGEYLHFADEPSVEAQYPLGPDGVPQPHYPWGVEDNPVTVAQWALQNWSWWLRGRDQKHLDATLRGADWLVARQEPDGDLPYLFDVDGAGVPMNAPWISAMAQGQAMSVWVRAHSQTGDPRYLDAAGLALLPFDLTFAEGGVLADWDGLPWYEEYPGERPLHVLNGFQFALIGLHDFAEHSEHAGELFAAGVNSLEQRIGVFDAVTVRSQFYGASGGSRGIVADVYRRAHAVLTRKLATITGLPNITAFAAKWEGYLRPLPPPPAPPKPPVVSPPPVVTPPPAPRPVVGRRCGRVRGVEVRVLGRVSCARARATLRYRLSRGRSPRGWRCWSPPRRWAVQLRCRRSGTSVQVRAMR